MIDYFFSGNQYIRVTRGDTGPGTVDPGYPAPISNWGWGEFGRTGIDAALFSGSKCFFFKGSQYIRVTRGVVFPGTVDPGYPKPISDWGWGAFGAHGIDAAFWSGDVCFFFKGNEYIKVRRENDTDLGTVDPGYPGPLTNWLWGSWGEAGISAALYSGSKNYFFQGPEYIRVSRGMEGAGLLDKGYPDPLSTWGWGEFGSKGIDAALNSDGPLVPPPSTGLISNFNYFLDANGLPLNFVAVKVNVDTDLDSTSNGWSFQLNCYSQELEGITTIWQQYAIVAEPNDSTLNAVVNNWSGTDISDVVINSWNHLGTMSHIAIKAGYAFQFFPHFDDKNNIVACRYIVTDNDGKVRGDKTINLIGQTIPGSKKKTTIANLAPIVAWTFNICGDYNLHVAKFVTGAGTITYSAGQALTVNTTEPSYTSFGVGTGESGNIVYCPLPKTTNTSISQPFQVPLTMPKVVPPRISKKPVLHRQILPPPTELEEKEL